jgi:hypothetical protein
MSTSSNRRVISLDVICEDWTGQVRGSRLHRDIPCSRPWRRTRTAITVRTSRQLLVVLPQDVGDRYSMKTLSRNVLLLSVSMIVGLTVCEIGMRALGVRG